MSDKTAIKQVLIEGLRLLKNGRAAPGMQKQDRYGNSCQTKDAVRFCVASANYKASGYNDEVWKAANNEIRKHINLPLGKFHDTASDEELFEVYNNAIKGLE